MSLIERLRGLFADALSAFDRSSAEKESLRGMHVCRAGVGIESVMLIGDFLI